MRDTDTFDLTNQYLVTFSPLHTHTVMLYSHSLEL